MKFTLQLALSTFQLIQIMLLPKNKTKESHNLS
jgi:hypothetical protein